MNWRLKVNIFNYINLDFPVNNEGSFKVLNIMHNFSKVLKDADAHMHQMMQQDREKITHAY